MRRESITRLPDQITVEPFALSPDTARLRPAWTQDRRAGAVGPRPKPPHRPRKMQRPAGDFRQ